MDFKELYQDNSSAMVETYGFMSGDYFKGDLSFSSCITKHETGWKGSFTINLNNLELGEMTADEARAEMESVINDKLKNLSKGNPCSKCGK